MTDDAHGRPGPDHDLRITEASDLLGVPAPTLRSWEARYGLPTTMRTAGGHRRYTADALHQLGLMRDEITVGRAPVDAARRVRGFLDASDPAQPKVLALMAASTSRDGPAIRAVLDDALDGLGLAATLDGVVMPAMRQIGAWWETGRCDVGQEHFTTEVVRGWLARISTLAPPTPDTGWVLLAVGPRDLHTLGIEALAALLVTQGVGCRTMGARTPQRVLVAATVATGAVAVVVVSHLPSQRRHAAESLAAVAATGCPTFYAGNAFLMATSRRGVVGSYLGESLTVAAASIRTALRRTTSAPPVAVRL